MTFALLALRWPFSSRKFLSFGYSAGVVALCLVLLVSMAGCSITQVQTDLGKVLSLLPDVAGITQTILTIAGSLNPAIQGYASVIQTDFASVQKILSSYQSNLASMPGTVIQQLDNFVSAINANMSLIDGLLAPLSPAVVAGVNVALLALQTILGYLASIFPPVVAQAMFPRSFSAMTLRGIKFGTAATTIPSPREFEKDFNQKISEKGFANAKIHVQWIHLGPLPVAP